MNTLPLQLAGLGIPTLIDPLFILGLLTQRKRYQALAAEHRTLVQEKEAALGFVQNVGSVFADAETVEMTHLLNVFFTMPFEPAKRIWSHLSSRQSEKTLSARALSGVMPPLFEVEPNTLQVGPDTTQQLHSLLTKKNSLSVKPSLVKSLSKETPNTSTMPKWMFAFHKRISNFTHPNPSARSHAIWRRCYRRHDSGQPHRQQSICQLRSKSSPSPCRPSLCPNSLCRSSRSTRTKTPTRSGHANCTTNPTLPLPQTLPWLPTVDVAGFNHPALDIGGDYYDVIEIDEKHIGLVIADVSGKGIGGALMMAVCRSVLQANAQNEYDPASMLTSLNQTSASISQKICLSACSTWY